MEPLSQYEIQELMAAMGRGDYPYPIGSMWTSREASEIFIVINHANLPTSNGPIHTLVLQALPSGESWIQPIENIEQNEWINMGFIWDRGISV